MTVNNIYNIIMLTIDINDQAHEFGVEKEEEPELELTSDEAAVVEKVARMIMLVMLMMLMMLMIMTVVMMMMAVQMLMMLLAMQLLYSRCGAYGHI